MSTFLSTSRGQFHLHVHGNSNQPPLLLVHGWPQTGYCWQHAAAHLKDFYVIAPDIRGMGDSNRELDLKYYSKDEMARDIFAIADALGLDQFYLGGHDWGSAIVQEMVFQQPERIRKLVLINMLIINNAMGLQKAFEVQVKQEFRAAWYQYFMSLKNLPEAMISGKEEFWIRFFSHGISHPIPEDAIAEYTRCYKIPHTITTAANIYRAIPQDRKRWQQYLGSVVDIPTKIIHGRLDPVIIREYLEGVEDVYSQIEIVYLDGGHFIVDEQPRAVAEAIRVFLLE